MKTALTHHFFAREKSPAVENDKIRILHTIGRLCLGGMEGGVVKLLNHLNRHRFSPHLITIRGYDEKVRLALAKDIKFTVFMRKEGRDWRLVRKLDAYFAHQQIDIVHSHNWETFLYSFLAARLARVPVFIHGEHGRNTEQIADSWRVAKIKSLLAWQSHRLTTVSQDIAEMIAERWQVNPAKILVIPNGIDSTRFQPANNRAAIKKQMGLPADSIIIGTVIGQIRPIKDLPTLLQAFGLVKRKQPQCRLVVVAGLEQHLAKFSSQDFAGNGISQCIQQFDLEDTVCFMNPCTDVENIMQAFDIYANSSLYEGMSNTILEAMSCGAAIVATSVGGTIHIVKNRVNGLLVPSKSPGKLAEAMCELVAKPELRERLAENGRKYVAEHHSLENFITAHERVYEEELFRKINKTRKVLENSHVRNLRIY